VRCSIPLAQLARRLLPSRIRTPARPGGQGPPMRDRRGPAHDARHRIPARRKSIKLVLVTRPGAAGVERTRTDAYTQQREETLYKAMMARAKEKQTDVCDYREDEGGRGIWVPERWVAVEYARGHVRLEVVGADGTKLLGVRKSSREDGCRAAIA